MVTVKKGNDTVYCSKNEATFRKHASLSVGWKCMRSKAWLVVRLTLGPRRGERGVHTKLLTTSRYVSHQTKIFITAIISLIKISGFDFVMETQFPMRYDLNS